MMLIVFLLALLSVFMGNIRGGNFVYRLCVLWADVWFALIGIKIKIIDKHFYDDDKKYIIVSNHISYLDIPVLLKVFRKPLRPLGKTELGKIPVFGFIYKKAIVSVDRSSAANRAASVAALMRMIRRGISILVFPEGTFNETDQPLKDFYNGAFRIAIETQTPLKPVIFLDTFDRMPYTSLFSISPGICRVIHLPAIGVEGLTVDDISSLRDKTFRLMEDKIITQKASWIKSNTDTMIQKFQP